MRTLDSGLAHSRASSLFILLVALATLLAAGCAESDSGTEEPAATEQEAAPAENVTEAAPETVAETAAPTPQSASRFSQYEILSGIPADTPYVFLALEPEGLDALPWSPSELVPLYDKFIEDIAPREAARTAAPAERTLDQSGQFLVWSLLKELDGKLSAEGLTSFGVDLDGTWAVYGLGIFPAVRITLDDPAAATATMDRVLERAELVVERPRIDFDGNLAPGGKSVDADASSVTLRVATLDPEWQMAVGVVGDELVATIAPTELMPTLLEPLAGALPAGSSLADSAQFETLATRYVDGSSLGDGFGYVDLVGTAYGFARKGAPLLGRSLDAVDAPRLEGVCADEWGSVAEHFPYLVAEFDPISFFDIRSGSVTLQMSNDELMAQLAQLRADVGTVAPTSEDASPTMSLGFNVDLDGALELLNAYGTAIGASPYQCDSLGWVNTTAARVVAAEMLVPKPLQGLRGGHFIIDELGDAPDGDPRGWGHVVSGNMDSLWRWAAPEVFDVDESETASALPSLGTGEVTLHEDMRIADGTVRLDRTTAEPRGGFARVRPRRCCASDGTAATSTANGSASARWTISSSVGWPSGPTSAAATA